MSEYNEQEKAMNEQDVAQEAPKPSTIQIGDISPWFSHSDGDGKYYINMEVRGSAYQLFPSTREMKAIADASANSSNTGTNLGDLLITMNNISVTREALVNNHARNSGELNEAMRFLLELLINDAALSGEDDKWDEHVRDLNRILPHFCQIPERIQEHEVEVVLTGTVTYRTTVLIEAASEEKAREMFNDNPDDYINCDEVLRSEARYAEWDGIDAEAE